MAVIAQRDTTVAPPKNPMGYYEAPAALNFKDNTAGDAFYRVTVPEPVKADSVPLNSQDPLLRVAQAFFDTTKTKTGGPELIALFNQLPRQAIKEVKVHKDQVNIFFENGATGYFRNTQAGLSYELESKTIFLEKFPYSAINHSDVYTYHNPGKVKLVPSQTSTQEGTNGFERQSNIELDEAIISVDLAKGK